jgi:hypothetical protein
MADNKRKKKEEHKPTVKEQANSSRFKVRFNTDRITSEEAAALAELVLVIDQQSMELTVQEVNGELQPMSALAKLKTAEDLKIEVIFLSKAGKVTGIMTYASVKVGVVSWNPRCSYICAAGNEVLLPNAFAELEVKETKFDGVTMRTW